VQDKTILRGFWDTKLPPSHHQRGLTEANGFNPAAGLNPAGWTVYGATNVTYAPWKAYSWVGLPVWASVFPSFPFTTIAILLSILGSVMGVASNSLLLSGSRKKKHAPVKAYLIIQAISMIAILVQVAFLAIAGREVQKGHGYRDLIRDQNIGIGILAANYTVFLGILVYFWIVAYSFYRQLKLEIKERGDHI